MARTTASGGSWWAASAVRTASSEVWRRLGRVRTASVTLGPAFGLVFGMVFGLVFSMGLAGCSKTKQLESVAKDWCTTIRASQVIPVYPLTEDLQPGDIFLVQVPIDRQQEVYRKRGFMPLDNHLGRLHPGAYAEFYGHSVVDEANPPQLPKRWMRPEGEGKSWDDAPHAAFPEYSFEVRNGIGANVGVPVYGIPVGLSLLGSNSANGTVIIKNARTIGIDMASLDADLRLWGAQNIGFLANFAPPAGEPPRNYLRVVSRVYAIGSIDVFLSDASSGGAGVDAGAARPVELLQPTTAQSQDQTAAENAKNWASAQKAVNDALAGGVGPKPGGSLRVSASSARSVGMEETFDPPLAIGYLGFDVAIGEGGLLGRPVPTLALLEDRVTDVQAMLAARPMAQMAQASTILDMYETLQGLGTDDAQVRQALAAMDALGSRAPDTLTVAVRGADGKVTLTQRTMPASGYERFRVYQSELDSTIRMLERGPAQPLPPEQATVLEAAKAAASDPATVAAVRSAEQALVVAYSNWFVRGRRGSI